MNTLESCIISSPINKSEVCAKFTIKSTREKFLLASVTQPGKEYTFSFWGKSAKAGSINAGGKLFNTSDIWARYIVTFTATDEHFSINFPANGTYYIYHAQLEIGNKATDWTPSPLDVEDDVKEAAKTASNYIEFTEENGLQIGNKTSGIWEGFRTQVTSTAFNILSAAGETLASYGAKLIELGKNAEDAVISMCGGKGKMSTTNINGTTYFDLSADMVRVVGIGVDTGCSTVQGGTYDNVGQFEAGGGENYAEAGIIVKTEYIGSDGNTEISAATFEMRSDILNHEDGTKEAETSLHAKAHLVTLISKNNMIFESQEGDVEIQGVNFGNADISSIGDGTLLGAIAALYEQTNKTS